MTAHEPDMFLCAEDRETLDSIRARLAEAREEMARGEWAADAEPEPCLTRGQLAAIRAIVSNTTAAGRDKLLAALDRLIDTQPRATEDQP